MRKIIKKEVVFLTWIVIMVYLIIQFSYAAPPSPKNVQGIVYHIGGEGVEDGIPVEINNTVTGEIFSTVVNAPPPRPGEYSSSING